jgi:hypothetical protein
MRQKNKLSSVLSGLTMGALSLGLPFRNMLHASLQAFHIRVTFELVLLPNLLSTLAQGQ